MSKFFDHMAEYLNSYSSRSEEELCELSEIKRYLEVYSGDEQFRMMVNSDSITLRKSAELAGVHIDVSGLLPIFHPSYFNEKVSVDDARWPLAVKWQKYISELVEMRQRIVVVADTDGRSEKFDRWRLRQIRRVAYDLGLAGQGIVHPPIAFELSSGCSVGCWFCGISADKFKGHFSLAGDGTAFWTGILAAAKSVLGEGLNSSFLYWATDPLDNPDYLGFLDEFYKVCGVYPQTTTAIPLRNKDLTLGVLDRWRIGQATPNRFSIINSKVLRKVHENFSPRSLLTVELVLQHFGNATNSKTNAGRTFVSTQAGGTPNTRKSHISEGSIACVSGFLVNLVERTVRLVSPCMPSDKYPNGYIVFDSKEFQTPTDLELIMRDMIDEYMPLEIAKHKPMALSENYRYHYNGGSFVLETPSTKITSTAVDSFAPFLTGEGATAMSVLRQAVEQGQNVFAVVDAIEKSREAGLIDMVFSRSPSVSAISA